LSAQRAINASTNSKRKTRAFVRLSRHSTSNSNNFNAPPRVKRLHFGAKTRTASRRARMANRAANPVIHRRADALLLPTRIDPEEERVARRLRKRRQWRFTFLDHPGVEATNNRAERALRPAVITRKLSCGNRTTRGKHTWEILASLAATCAQRG
jgi:hypothetical protein